MTHRNFASKTKLMRSLSAVTALIGCLGTSIGAAASPVTYTIFAVTDVSLDGHFYHNAQVHLKFVGDSSDVQPFDVTLNGFEVRGFQITKGTASLLIISGRRHIRATFLPNQILVSLDITNGGGGFSSVGPDGLAPAYPLAVDGSSIDYADDLVTPKAYTGHAWSCVGFPPGDNSTGRCFAPIPLHTDHGDFLIYQPYQSFYSGGPQSLSAGTQGPYSGSLNNGIFTVIGGPASKSASNVAKSGSPSKHRSTDTDHSKR